MSSLQNALNVNLLLNAYKRKLFVTDEQEWLVAYSRVCQSARLIPTESVTSR